MRTYLLLLLLATMSAVAGCGSSSQPTPKPPEEQNTYFRLTVSSVTDANGVRLEQYFGPVPFALKVRASKQGEVFVPVSGAAALAINSRLQREVRTRFEKDTSVAFDLSSTLSIDGVTTRAQGFSSQRYAIAGITSLRGRVGGKLAAGDELEAVGKLESPEQGDAGAVKVQLRVQLDEAPAELILSPGPFNGKYLHWLGLNPAFDKPVELDGPYLLRIEDRPPFALDDKPTSVWDLQGSSILELGDPRPRQLIIPGGTDWSGRAVSARTVNLNAVQVEPKTSFDFATDEGLSLAGGAAVASDPDCETGTCLVLRSAAPSADGVCRVPAQVVFGINDSANRNTRLRMRALGFDAAVWERMKLWQPLQRSWIEPGIAAPRSVGRTDFAYDSGWTEVFASGAAHTFHIVILACQQGMKVLVQRAAVM